MAKLTGDALVQDNQAKAANLGVSIPGVGGTITSTDLTPTKSFDLTQPTPSTQTDGALGAIASTSDAFTQNLADAAKTREKASTDSLQAYLDAVTNEQGQTTLTDAAYSKTVDPAEADLKDINQQITAEQVALNHRLTALDKNSQGYFGTGLDQEKQKIKDESLARQADLSVVQLAKQGKYDSAKAIADRAVAAKMEQQQNVLDALKTNYEANKDLFTTAEQRSFESQLADRTRTLDMQDYQEKARYDQLIKQSDPLYQAQLATEQAKTAPAGGEAQLAQLQSHIGDVSSLVSSGALSGAVGPNGLARFAPIASLTGAKTNFIAGVEQLRAQLSLDSLTNAKKNGATFGALSEGELKLLQDSGSKLSTWAVKDKTGKVVGYNANEADFKKELDKINNFSKLDYLLKGGDPASVGVVQQPDGTFWTKNSDGTYTQLK